MTPMILDMSLILFNFNVFFGKCFILKLKYVTHKCCLNDESEPWRGQIVITCCEWLLAGLLFLFGETSKSKKRIAKSFR